MLRKLLTNSNYVSADTKYWLLQNRLYCERRRRKGDGSKSDIFEERAGASQNEYFRKQTAHQLERLREKLKKEKEEQAPKTTEEKDETNKKESENKKFSTLNPELEI